MAQSVGGCDVFVHLALSQIIEQCTAYRRLSKVKDACQALLDDIAAKKHQGHTVETVVAYVEPLKLACESMEPKLAIIALDCLQKLMAYRFIRNDMYHTPKKMPDGTLRTHSVLSTVVATICQCIKIANEPIVQLQIIRCSLTAVTDCEAHDNALQSLVSSVFSLMIHSKESINQTTARTHLTQMINFIFNRLESSEADTSPPVPIPDSMTSNGTNGGDSATPDTISADGTATPPKGRRSSGGSGSSKAPLTVNQRDAMVVFNFLCKISNTEINESTPPDSPQLRKCLQALEWIHKILQSSGPAFRSSSQLLHGIREPLCHSLLKNCVSPVPGVFKISLDIFVTLICHFKRYLKSEIGLLLKNVFLWLLESTNTQYNQKAAVIQALQKVCSSSQVIIDIFVNYDCEMHSPNILERIVDSMSKMVQTEHLESNWITAKEATMLKELSLQSLVLILSSLVKWMNKFTATGHEDSEEDFSDLPEVLDGAHSTDPSGLPMSERLEKQRLKKIEIEKGVAEFNKKPKKGIKYWVDCGLLDNTPKDIGRFLRFTEGIDKQMIGDYLGEEPEFNRKALLSYVETLDFTGLSIDNALRKFLSVFALPGEGQKIERILEQFSEAFLKTDQTGTFECPDAIYILAVAIVMLNTDLHNPQVKEKMSRQQFLSQLKGINNGKDLPTPFLEGIFERIETKPFSNDDLGNIHSAAAAETLAVLGSTGSSLFLSKKERKQMQYTVESRSMLKQTKDLLDHRAGHINEKYYAANDITYVRPIFSVIWAPIHAAFSTTLETVFEPSIIRFCLEGFEHGIHIASLFELPTEREAFVSALTKMTYINNLKQMSRKNIDSIHTLIKIANHEGDILQNSWIEVIRTISQLERLQV